MRGSGWAQSVPAPMWAGVSPFSPGADVGGGEPIQSRRRCGRGEPTSVPAQMWAGVSPLSPGADVGRRWGGPIVSAMTSSTESSVRQRLRNTPPITCEYPQYPLLCEYPQYPLLCEYPPYPLLCEYPQ
jgi:hypothetical protein